ncbi:MAG TPA: HD domain-containing phosphohydrolase [Thermoleophilaceae bacterium]|nr:HD domain-containing phosphohydrolase [Thermoleophilaceae bacterium]
MDTKAHQPVTPSACPEEAGQRHLRFEQALLERLERHAPEVYDHMRRTACLAALVSDHLELSEGVKEVVVCTAELHDIGKLALARELLGKRTPLDATEQRALREHSVLGYRLPKWHSELEGIALMVRASQEWHDGSGYPDGLSGERIPLPARIVSVCDAFDTLTEGRPYRPSLAAGEALQELRRWAGIRFDPVVVEALSETLKEWGMA